MATGHGRHAPSFVSLHSDEIRGVLVQVEGKPWQEGPVGVAAGRPLLDI
jgi:hypothetical protein